MSFNLTFTSAMCLPGIKMLIFMFLDILFDVNNIPKRNFVPFWEVVLLQNVFGLFEHVLKCSNLITYLSMVKYY